MSVINQMLKDLEQRSPEANNNTGQVNNTALAHSPIKIALVTGVCVLALCLLSFYIWQLITENNALKSEQLINRANATEAKVTNDLTVSTINDDIAPTSAEVTTSQERILETETSAAEITQQANSSVIDNASVNNNVSRLTPVKSTAVKSTAVKRTPEKTPPQLANTRRDVKHVGQSVAATMPARTQSAITQSAITQSAIQSAIQSTAQLSTELISPVKPAKNQMSVSRRQLSADELAEQKIAEAEKALAAKQIEKAEQLLEDAIIIRPSDSQTRKQLAALWFGRQAYQDAVNLLSQGIALNGQDSSLRMMQARIHLKQGQVTSALNTLKPLAQFKNEQYQIMLANTAQQAQQSKVAVNAYKVLITMQPNIGRWHLGLAVLYDQNSQFTLASAAYKQALANNDLSIASEDFVNDRIQAIGQ